MQDMSRNPFVHQSPIVDASSFVNRKFELEFLYKHLSDGRACHVVGPYGYGKTSLLNYVKILEAQKDRREYSIAYINPRLCQTGKELWNQTWASWVDVNEEYPKPIAQHYRLQAPIDFIKRWSRYGPRPVLCLDDFEQIVQKPRVFTSNFFLDLQALMQQGIPIVTASRWPMGDLLPSHSPASLLLNSFTLLRLGPLPPEEARNFILSQPQPDVPTFNPEEIEAILKLAKGSPLALQTGCYYIAEARRKGLSLQEAIETVQRELQLLQIEGELEDLQTQYSYSQIKKSSGGKVEKLLQSLLELYGYECTSDVRVGHGEWLRNRADIAAEGHGRSLLFSIKWQTIPGSAEQKVPFEVISLIDSVKRSYGEYQKAYLILGGDGWRLLDFYTAGGLNEYIRDIELVNIVTFQRFIELIKNDEL